MMNPYRCYYHPQIEAIAKCEKCGKYLCLECKQIYHRRVGGANYRSYVTLELCPECYDKQETYHLLFFIVFFVIFIIALLLILQNFQNFTSSNDPFFP